MLSITGTFGAVHCLYFVLVLFKSIAVQTLFLFLFLYLSIRVAIRLPMLRFCPARGESYFLLLTYSTRVEALGSGYAAHVRVP